MFTLSYPCHRPVARPELAQLPGYQHKNLLLSATRSLAVFGSCNVRPGVIFKLHCFAQVPLERPACMGFMQIK
jgi:hypothetical protein